MVRRWPGVPARGRYAFFMRTLLTVLFLTWVAYAADPSSNEKWIRELIDKLAITDTPAVRAAIVTPSRTRPSPTGA